MIHDDYCLNFFPFYSSSRLLAFTLFVLVPKCIWEIVPRYMYDEKMNQRCIEQHDTFIFQGLNGPIPPSQQPRIAPLHGAAILWWLPPLYLESHLSKTSSAWQQLKINRQHLCNLNAARNCAVKVYLPKISFGSLRLRKVSFPFRPSMLNSHAALSFIMWASMAFTVTPMLLFAKEVSSTIWKECI